MKPSKFRYHRVRSQDELLQLLADNAGDARILAGGQSLIPMMNLRVAAPALLLDINDLQELGQITVEPEVVRIGALVRYRQLEASSVVKSELPLIAAALPHVAHLAIRNRGTLGGSLALADPAAEMPACILALDATLVVASIRGRRRIAAADFFRGPYETALGPDEMLEAVEIPRRPDALYFFDEVARRHGDYAIAGLAGIAPRPRQETGSLRLVYFGVSDRPHLARSALGLLAAGPVSDDRLAAAEAAVIEGLGTVNDGDGQGALRRHLARVLFRRAVRRLTEQSWS
mgnify:CR=1 FL=1